MPEPTATPLNFKALDVCLRDREGLIRVREALQKIEKICSAVDKNLNLADIVRDPGNQSSLLKAFGESEFAVGMQALMRLGLADFECRSFTTRQEIKGEKRVDFVYRSIGGWKQFQMTMAVQLPGSVVLLINPSRQEHWAGIESLPAGTLITIYLRGAGGKRSPSQEALAAERVEAVFDTVQDRTKSLDSQPTPVIEMFRKEENRFVNGNGHPANGHAKAQAAKPAAPARRPSSTFKSNVPTIKRSFAPSATSPKGMAALGSADPVMSFKVVINKMDTFVHAGNAHLILSHLRDYAGRVQFYVIRAEKKNVQLDADSIWGAEIRNGETVLFEFFGPQPSDEFVKELAKKVNKYTQMDKIAE